MKWCNVYLTSKTVQYKSYNDLQFLPIPTYCWKDLSIDFIIDLPILTYWKRNNYDSILLIVNQLTKMVYYNPVKVSIDVLGLTEVIINVVLRHHDLLNLIVTNQGLLFISKFWLLLCYFFGIKRRLFTTFYP